MTEDQETIWFGKHNNPEDHTLVDNARAHKRKFFTAYPFTG